MIQTTNKMQQLFHLLIFFNSALHVSGYKFAHLQEHFLTVYTVKKCSCRWAN